MLTDRYGLALSTTSPRARDAYVEGSDLVLTLYPGAVAAFDRAIAADPGFALAHAGRARALQVASDIAGAQAAIAASLILAGGLPERTRSRQASARPGWPSAEGNVRPARARITRALSRCCSRGSANHARFDRHAIGM